MKLLAEVNSYSNLALEKLNKIKYDYVVKVMWTWKTINVNEVNIIDILSNNGFLQTANHEMLSFARDAVSIIYGMGSMNVYYIANELNSCSFWIATKLSLLSS